MISCLVRHRIARSIKTADYAADQELPLADTQDLFLFKEGESALFCGHHFVELQSAGGFVGEERVLLGAQNLFHAHCTGRSKRRCVPKKAIENVPIVPWKLLETYKRRMSLPAHKKENR